MVNKRAYGVFVKLILPAALTVKAFGSMAAELSLFLLRLIHSRFRMPLKLSAGTLLM